MKPFSLTTSVAEEEVLQVRKRFLVQEEIRCPYCLTTKRAHIQYRLREYYPHLRNRHPEMAQRWYSIQRRLVGIARRRRGMTVQELLTLAQPFESVTENGRGRVYERWYGGRRLICPVCHIDVSASYVRQHLLNDGVTNLRQRSLMVEKLMEEMRVRVGIRR